METPENEQLKKLYWRKVVFYFIGLMVAWFLILIVTQVIVQNSPEKVAYDQFHFGQWFSHSGLTFLFVGIIVIFLVLIKRLHTKMMKNQS